jgi:hypothetical protein
MTDMIISSVGKMTRKGSGDNSSKEEVEGVAIEWLDKQTQLDLTT